MDHEDWNRRYEASELLWGAEKALEPEDWSPDGAHIAVNYGGVGGNDLWIFPVDGQEEPYPFVVGNFDEGYARFSPDGRWLAYLSNESGKYELYATRFPSGEGKWQLSTEGGKGPVWSRDGREIFYTDGYRMMVVRVETEPTFSAGEPRQLFEYGFDRAFGPTADYDVTPDGTRFLMFHRPHDDPPLREVSIVTNLAALLRR